MLEQVPGHQQQHVDRRQHQQQRRKEHDDHQLQIRQLHLQHPVLDELAHLGQARDAELGEVQSQKAVLHVVQRQLVHVVQGADHQGDHRHQRQDDEQDPQDLQHHEAERGAPLDLLQFLFHTHISFSC